MTSSTSFAGIDGEGRGFRPPADGLAVGLKSADNDNNNNDMRRDTPQNMLVLSVFCAWNSLSYLS